MVFRLRDFVERGVGGESEGLAREVMGIVEEKVGFSFFFFLFFLWFVSLQVNGIFACTQLSIHASMDHPSADKVRD